MAGVTFRDVSNVRKRFRSSRPRSEDSRRGVLVLVGPSAAGKAPALRMIAGSKLVSGGTIRSRPRRQRPAAEAPRLAMVFPNYALSPLTVRENLAFGLQMRRRPRAEIAAAVADAADILAITHLLDRSRASSRVASASSFAFGRAHRGPRRRRLFDEPLSNLDAKLRARNRAELQRLPSASETTTVYFTQTR